MTKSVLQLVQFTDPHLFGDPAGRLRGVATLPALQATLAAARADIAASDAILATGDLVQDDPGGYARFRAEFGALGRPVLCVPGNHDHVPAMRAALATLPPLSQCEWRTPPSRYAEFLTSNARVTWCDSTRSASESTWWLATPFYADTVDARRLEHFRRHVLNAMAMDLPLDTYFDLRPAAIIRDLDLRRPIYRDVAAYGHFGRDDLDVPWERTDKAAALRAAAGLAEKTAISS